MGQKFTMKVSDGSVWDELYPKSTVDQISTDKEIEVQLTENLGAYRPGDIIPVGTTVEEFIEKLTQTRVPPVYKSPVLSVLNTGETDYEAGTLVSANIIATLTKNDAGPATLTARKNGATVSEYAGNSIEWGESFQVEDNINIYEVRASYEEGPVKNDSLGEPHPSGHIFAGLLTSAPMIINGKRKLFIGSDKNVTPCADSIEVRSLTTSRLGPSGGNSFNVSATVGDTRMTIAYPDYLKDLTGLRYEEGGYDIKNLLTKTAVDVEGYSGFTAIPYKVYTLIFPQPIPANMTFTATI